MDYEAEAKKQGWNPEYEGPNKVDAKTFVEKGEKLAPILKSRVDRAEKQIESLQTVNQEYGQQMQSLLDKEKQKNADLLTELEDKRAKAVTDGDGQEFTRIDREIETVKSDMNTNVRNPQADAWLIDNDWYSKDRDLQAYADGICGQIEAEGYSGPAYWKELSRRTKEAHPDKFKNPNREKSNGVEQGADTPPKNSKEQIYENLPAEMKAACDRFVKNDLMTQDDYVKNFEWDK